MSALGLAETMTEVTTAGPDSLNTEFYSAVTKCSVYLNWGTGCAGDKGRSKGKAKLPKF